MERRSRERLSPLSRQRWFLVVLDTPGREVDEDIHYIWARNPAEALAMSCQIPGWQDRLSESKGLKGVNPVPPEKVKKLEHIIKNLEGINLETAKKHGFYGIRRELGKAKMTELIDMLVEREAKSIEQANTAEA